MSDSGKPTVAQALGLLGIFLGFQTVLGTVVLAATVVISRKMEVNLTFVAVANVLAMVPTIWLGSVICRRPWRELVRFGGWRWRLVPPVLLMGLGGFVLCSEIENVTRLVLPMPDSVARLFGDLLNVRSNPWGAALALVLVAPLTEEPLCRGWVLAALLRKGRPTRAIFGSAVIFGAMHMNPWQFFYASALGVAFGWIYWCTRSMWLCMFAHALNNAIAWFVAFSALEIPGLSGGGFGEAVQFQSIWLDLAALGIVGLGAWWLWHRTRTSVPPPLPLAIEAIPASGTGVLPPHLPPA